MKRLLGHRRHGQALGAAGEAGGVGLRAEGGDAAVGLGVGLEALEDRLRVVQDRGGRVQLQRRVGGQPGVVPALPGLVAGDEHAVGEVPAEARVGQHLRALGVGTAGHVLHHERHALGEHPRGGTAVGERVGHGSHLRVRIGSSPGSGADAVTVAAVRRTSSYPVCGPADSQHLVGPEVAGGGRRGREGVPAPVVGPGEVLAGLPRLVRLLAAPAGVDEVLVGALQRAEELEPLEAGGLLDGAGPAAEPLLEAVLLVRRHR